MQCVASFQLLDVFSLPLKEMPASQLSVISGDRKITREEEGGRRREEKGGEGGGTEIQSLFIFSPGTCIIQPTIRSADGLVAVKGPGFKRLDLREARWKISKADN